MKLKLLTKTIPFISTLVLIFILYNSNHKENTKLRILIWNTPSYSLGTYLAASTGIGFIISYLLTTSLANINKSINNKSLEYKYKNYNDDTRQYNDSYFKKNDEKTLIERDINDPSPTVNAQFRVIGKIGRYDTIDNDNRVKYDTDNDYEESNFDRDNKSESFNPDTKNMSDWNDNSFLSW